MMLGATHRGKMGVCEKFRLISFDETGEILINPGLDLEALEKAGVRPGMRLRKLLPGHVPFLAWHRTKFYEKMKSD